MSLDLLIAEAKRRARQRRLVALVALLVVAAVGSFAVWELAGANASARAVGGGNRCAKSSTYGTQCLDVLGSGRRVTAVRTSFDDTGMFWPDSRWRIDLERYSCNPSGKPKVVCWPAAIWHGRVLTGTPIVDRAAQPLRRAQSRSGGYWPTLSLPQTFRSNGWLCTETAVYNRTTGRWVYNGAGLPHGLRACVSVGP